MEKTKVNLKEIKKSAIKNYYDIVFANEKNEAISITIGEFEANNIVLCLEKLPNERPMTYDVFHLILKSFNIKLKEINITKFYDGVYFANALFEGLKEPIDMRPSDAINIAIREMCPIYLYNNVLEETGFKIETTKTLPLTSEDCLKTVGEIENLSIFGINMLKDLLKDAIEREDYQTASLLRDKIKGLNKNKDC